MKERDIITQEKYSYKIDNCTINVTRVFNKTKKLEDIIQEIVNKEKN